MLSIKKQIIKNLVKFRVVHSIPGRVRLRTKLSPENYKQVKLYDDYLEKAIKLLDGIEDVEFNYTIGTVVIRYDFKKVYESKIVAWIDEIIRIGIDNSELIEKYGETDLDYVIETVEQQLKEAVKRI